MSQRPKIQVRDAQPEEQGSIRELTLSAYAEFEEVMEAKAWNGLDAAVRGALRNEQEDVQRIVAVRDGRIVGSVMLYPPATDAYGEMSGPVSWPELRLLAVSPDARGEGVGQLLVEECVRRARAMGADSLGLHTSRSMRTAIRMYERMGFVRSPEHDFQPEGAELVTAYRLPIDPTASGAVQDNSGPAK